MHVSAFQKSRRSLKLFSDFNTLQFASVMAMVVFVILLVFMTIPVDHRGVSVDLPKVSHAIPMRGALREDAMKISVLRDGKIYFGTDQIDPAALPQKIKERLNDDHSVERKVYISADARTRWANVKNVLEGVRASGILRVVVLADQRRIAPKL